MNVQVETEPHCVTTLRIELPPDTVSATAARVLNDFVQIAKIPGFRPGKVPKPVVQSRFKKQIDEEMERSLISEACRKAIREKGLRVLSMADVSDVEVAPDQSMRFTVKLVTVPEFDLPEYKGVPVKIPSGDVTEAEIDESLETLRSQHADFTDAPERPLGWDDFAVIDYRGTHEGKPVLESFPAAAEPLARREDFWIRMTPESFLPGFCEQLLGALPGETRQVAVTVPDDFPMKEMAGAALEYSVSLKAIKERKLPDLDDAFAAQVLPGATLGKLREMCAEQLRRTKGEQAERERRNQVLDHLLAGVSCDLPQGMVRNETRRILTEIVEENQARGIADEVLKENEREILGVASRNAENRVKTTFILLKVAEAEKIEVTNDDLTKHLMNLAMRLRIPPQKLVKEITKRDAMDQIRQEVLTGKALDFLAANATVDTISGEPTPGATA